LSEEEKYATLLRLNGVEAKFQNTDLFKHNGRDKHPFLHDNLMKN
jgi:hypothetical protein